MKIVKFIFLAAIAFITFSFLNYLYIIYYNNTHKTKAAPIIRAINAYSDKYNKYPEKLNDLMPEIINDVNAYNNDYYYKVWGKYYFISFKRKVLWFQIESQWESFWSKTNNWHISDDPVWPEVPEY